MVLKPLTLIAAIFSIVEITSTEVDPNRSCRNLRMGQYICEDALFTNETSYFVDSCQRSDVSSDRYVRKLSCYPAPGVQCDGVKFDGMTVAYHQEIPCNKKSDKSFKTALLLSIFLGMFGVDRFYLGYPALGLLKLSTFGFMLVGQLIDIILIAAQVVKPADGGDYDIDYFGARMSMSGENPPYPVP